MEPCNISKALMRRLPLYLNHLKSLPGEDGNISATSIANSLGLGHVLVRKDLAKISGEGRRRTGRSRQQLIRDIETYLDYASTTTTVVVGTGMLGQALLDYRGFEESGLNVLAGFDSQPALKQSDSGKPIYPMSRLSSFCKLYNVRIGIIAVPAEKAQAVCDNLIVCGVQAIWNFSSACLTVPMGMILQNENWAISGTNLRMQLKNR